MNVQIKMNAVFSVVYNVGTAIGQGVGGFLPRKSC